MTTRKSKFTPIAQCSQTNSQQKVLLHFLPQMPGESNKIVDIKQENDEQQKKIGLKSR